MNKSLGKVCVVGLGYIGLPTASLLATKGYQVHGVDVSRTAVDGINRGEIHIYEPDLDVLVKSAVQSGRLKASLEPSSADVFIIAVPTPFKDGHVPDLSFVEAATKSIAGWVQPGNLVILESTSPVGTTEQVAQWLRATNPKLALPAAKQKATSGRGPASAQVFVAHCPERVLPGRIMRELVENDRVVGGLDPASAEKAAAFYRTFVAGQVLLTDCRTAEMCKLTENAFRDVNIAFANELSIICDKLSVDVWELIRLANHHPRVKILQPGPGVGGHCIAVDPWFIVNSAPDEARLIRTAREVNDSKPAQVVAAVRQHAAKLKKPVIACLGLSFKADIDDLRESPAIEIVCRLAEEKLGTILVVEPYVSALPAKLAALPVRLVQLQAALVQADIILLLADHREFRAVDRKALNGKIVLDTRGAWR
ncbi:MAG TPA: UDP-N-acetyl-D-mannosamine dehydrogenase [Planctomycetota bacterium]|jgi:UDP-N-acetyl-D-mannosaminuronic acid dehydrogenase